MADAGRCPDCGATGPIHNNTTIPCRHDAPQPAPELGDLIRAIEQQPAPSGEPAGFEARLDGLCCADVNCSGGTACAFVADVLVAYRLAVDAARREGMLDGWKEVRRQLVEWSEIYPARKAVQLVDELIERRSREGGE